MSFIMDMLGLTPAKPQVPVAPTEAQSTATADLAAQEQQRKLERGRTSTLLTGGTGLASLGTTSKTLLGQ